MRGVQLCGAAKNVIAIAAGICDGLGFGDNARSALITRGLAEMTRLGSALGADPRTYAGLAGLGDLVATCTSRHSRNRAAGELIARGVSPQDAERQVGMVVEGLHTAPALSALAREAGVDLPITEAVCSVIRGTPIPDAIAALLGRPAGSSAIPHGRPPGPHVLRCQSRSRVRPAAGRPQIQQRLQAEAGVDADDARERVDDVGVVRAAAALVEHASAPAPAPGRGGRRARS